MGAEYIEDYLIGRTGETADSLEEIERLNLTLIGTSQGQIAIYDGAGFVAGALNGDSAVGVSVTIVTSPTVALKVSIAQDLRTTASPEFAGLTLGGGVEVKAITQGTFSLDPGSIRAQARGGQTVTLAGAAGGDVVILVPPDGLNSGLVYAGCRVTAGDTLTVYLANITGSPIDDGSLTWDYLWFDLT